MGKRPARGRLMEDLKSETYTMNGIQMAANVSSGLVNSRLKKILK